MQREVVVGTVIQYNQRSNDDHRPRWERTQRAALLDQYHELQAPGGSLRQAAQARHGPRRTLQAWRAYRRAASARLAKDMPAKAITLAQADTCTGGLCLVATEPVSHDLVSGARASAHARAHDPWHVLMAQALAGLNCHVIQSTSDEAPGLLASVEPHLGAHPSPDLLHGQPALVKAISGALATKQRAAGKADTEAQAMLEPRQERLQHSSDAPAKRGPGRPPTAAARLEPVAQQAEAASRESQRLSGQREKVAQSLRAIGHAYHWVD